MFVGCTTGLVFALVLMVAKFEILVPAYVALVIFVIGFRHRAEGVVAIAVVTPAGAFFVVVEDTHPLFLCRACERYWSHERPMHSQIFNLSVISAVDVE